MHRDDSGGWLANLRLQSKTLLAFGVVLTLFFLSSLSFFASLTRAEEARRAAARVNQAIGELDRILENILNQETGLRGYLGNGDIAFLAPFNEGRIAFDRHWQNAKAMAGDDAAKHSQLDRLRERMELWRTRFADAAILVESEQQAVAARDRALGEESKELVDEMRAVLATLAEAERLHYARLETELDDQQLRARALTAVMLVMGVLTVLYVLTLVGRLMTRPLEQLATLMQQLSDGDTRVAVPHRSRRDEVGALARGVEAFRAALQKTRSQAEELEERGRTLNDYNRRLEMTQEELQRKADDLERASRYKSEFLANMSHELRTPLNSLLILSKSLAANEEANLNAEQVESARIIHDGGHTLLRLINDILDLSKIEAGKMDLMTDELEPAAFGQSLERHWRPVAKERGLRFEVRTAPGLPLIHTDSSKLKQILSNLLSNAFKFTERGQVSVSLERPADAAFALCIAVHDSGIGIPAGKLDKIFEAFEQVDASTSRRYGGTGLGLAICRGLAQRMGGDIRVESREGEGSTFLCLLPEKMPAATPRKAAPPRPAARPPAQGPLGVLVVEDDRAARTAVRNLLIADGLEVMEAATAAEARSHLAQRVPHGMILDLLLPDTPGLVLLEQLAREQHLPPTVIYTAKMLSGEEMARARAHTDSIVVKEPVPPPRLLEQLRERMRQAIAPAVPPSPAPAGHALKGRTVLIVDDDMRNVFALSKVLRGSGATVLTAADGPKALTQLEAQRAIEIVLMDIMMPGMDGYEATRRIRANPAWANLPVIAVTAKAMPGDREKCLAAGANDYITKPVDVDRLMTLMQSLLKPAP